MWDGASLLTVRPASEVEIAAFKRAEASDADEDVEEPWEEAETFSVVYLVQSEDEDLEGG